MPLHDDVVIAAFIIASTVSAVIVPGELGSPGGNGFHLHSRIRRGRKGYDDDEKHFSDGCQHLCRGRCYDDSEKTESWAPETNKRHVLKSY